MSTLKLVISSSILNFTLWHRLVFRRKWFVLGERLNILPVWGQTSYHWTNNKSTKETHLGIWLPDGTVADHVKLNKKERMPVVCKNFRSKLIILFQISWISPFICTFYKLYLVLMFCLIFCLNNEPFFQILLSYQDDLHGKLWCGVSHCISNRKGHESLHTSKVLRIFTEYIYKSFPYCWPSYFNIAFCPGNNTINSEIFFIYLSIIRSVIC